MSGWGVPSPEPPFCRWESRRFPESQDGPPDSGLLQGGATHILSRGCNQRAGGFTEQMLGWGSTSTTGPPSLLLLLLPTKPCAYGGGLSLTPGVLSSLSCETKSCTALEAGLMSPPPGSLPRFCQLEAACPSIEAYHIPSHLSLTCSFNDSLMYSLDIYSLTPQLWAKAWAGF